MLTLKSIAKGRLVKSNTNVSIRLQEYHQCIITLILLHQSTSSCLLKVCKKRYKISQFKEATNNTINISNTSH